MGLDLGIVVDTSSIVEATVGGVIPMNYTECMLYLAPEYTEMSPGPWSVGLVVCFRVHRWLDFIRYADKYDFP